MTPSQRCWQVATPWFEAMCTHPFVTTLIEGTLPDEVFTRYLLDDAHYLDRYARTLSALAARAPDVAGIVLLSESASETVAAERGLHRDFLAPRGLDPDAAGVPEASPACVAYTGWLESAANSATFDVALAAVVPCFRVYAEVGRFVAERRLPGDHRYAAWIDTYADPVFAEAVQQVERYLDQVVHDESAVIEAYVRSARFEWMFWDSAYRGDSWPSPGGVQHLD